MLKRDNSVKQKEKSNDEEMSLVKQKKRVSRKL